MDCQKREREPHSQAVDLWFLLLSMSGCNGRLLLRLLLLGLLLRVFLRLLLDEAVQGPLDGVQSLVDGLRLLSQLQLTLELLQGLLLRVQNLSQAEGVGG